MFEAWTDGACEPNPGVGGWGYLLISADGAVSENYGGERQTTNNRMELRAILMALKALPNGAMAVIYSDSQYCVNGLTIWGRNWQRRNWHKKDGAPMPNRDLWLLIHEQTKRVSASFTWVRGHAGNSGNERADALADLGRAGVLEVA